MTEHQVRSPIPGIFYRRPTPGEPPFAEVGDEVTADQTLGVVEIMKQFSPVSAGAAGRVTAFVAENEGEIGPGDVIATIEQG